jgi:glutamate dehydrogenase
VGFYPKRLPQEGTRGGDSGHRDRRIQNLYRGLLDLTDNIGPDGKIVSPAHVLRRDGDDPYLVVAADKGTATFSDIANELALSRGFWLGDAFASGGSQGYDHKKMGITARGAWEAVKRHFREMGRDIQSKPFTCVGVGDMSGDVFGNAMLRSETTKLLAAFDHRHIFIDPDPDPARAFTERQRLFDKPRSSWADYEVKLISRGGGVFPRTAKDIALSEEMKRLTGIEKERATPAEVIRALLTTKVDLLFFRRHRHLHQGVYAVSCRCGRSHQRWLARETGAISGRAWWVKAPISVRRNWGASNMRAPADRTPRAAVSTPMQSTIPQVSIPPIMK